MQDRALPELHQQSLPPCFFPHYVFCWCLRKSRLTKIISTAIAQGFVLKADFFFLTSPLPIKNNQDEEDAFMGEAGAEGLNCWLYY